MKHYSKVCKHCGTTYAQCRCPGSKTVTLGVCEHCRKQQEKEHLLKVLEPHRATLQRLAEED